MNANKAKRIIHVLAILTLMVLLLFGAHPIAHVVGAACVLVSVLLLYRYLPELSNVSPENPKTKTLRLVTIINIMIVIGCILLAILEESGLIAVSDQAADYILPILFAALIIGFGNLAPKLPFNRYTGLRLPWTVSDEETWIVAHRLLGYLAFPCGILCLVHPVVMLLAWIIIPSALSGVFYFRKYHVKKN